MTNWHSRFIELARHFSTWSKDPSTQVGAVIVDSKRLLLGQGYNGFPRGIEDDEAVLNDRPMKYLFMVHAEANAILNASSTEGATLYCTHAPCSPCAKLIIQAGIAAVYYPEGPMEIGNRWSEDQELARKLMTLACVTIRRVPDGH